MGHQPGNGALVILLSAKNNLFVLVAEAISLFLPLSVFATRFIGVDVKVAAVPVTFKDRRDDLLQFFASSSEILLTRKIARSISATNSLGIVQWEQKEAPSSIF